MMRAGGRVAQLSIPVFLAVLIVLALASGVAKFAHAQDDPTPTPNAPPGPDGLTATCLAPDGSFAIAYPADWQVEEAGSGVIFHNQAQGLATLTPGQARITVTITQTGHDTLRDTADALIGPFALWPSEEPQALVLGERAALAYTFSAGGFADAYYVLVLDLGDGRVATVALFTMGGQILQTAPLAEAMAATLSVWPPLVIEDGAEFEIDTRALVETFTSTGLIPGIPVTVAYPAGWFVDEPYPQQIAFASAEGLTESAPGELYVTLALAGRVPAGGTVPPDMALLLLSSIPEPALPIRVRLDGRTTAYALPSDGRYDVTLIAVALDDQTTVLLRATTAVEDTARYTPLLLALASTVSPVPDTAE
ncbi:MAG: hypothetical protein JW910_18950 [Anaerolineae bacterium]|nr:hypothetical protein [Anaerolineae bacterium]